MANDSNGDPTGFQLVLASQMVCWILAAVAWISGLWLAGSILCIALSGELWVRFVEFAMVLIVFMQAATGSLLIGWVMRIGSSGDSSSP